MSSKKFCLVHTLLQNLDKFKREHEQASVKSGQENKDQQKDLAFTLEKIPPA